MKKTKKEIGAGRMVVSTPVIFNEQIMKKIININIQKYEFTRISKGHK